MDEYLPRRRLDALDGWRTVSVALVIVNHLARYSSIGASGFRSAVFDAYGHLGVQIFFCISGFVICRGLDSELKRNGRISLLGFQVRRFFRIVPPLLFYLCTVTALALTGVVAYDFTALVSALTFTCNLTSGCGGFVGNHLWSLAVEAQFYLVFPLILIALGSGRRAALGLLVFALPVGLLTLSFLGLKELASFLSNFLCIVVGVACAQYSDRLERWLRRSPAWLPLLTMVGLLLIVSLVGPNRVSTIARYFFIPPLVGLALMATIYKAPATNRFFEAPALTAIGRASYTLYLWQQLATAPYPNAGPVFYAISLTLCVAFSLLSYRYFESHLNSWAANVSRMVRP